MGTGASLKMCQLPCSSVQARLLPIWIWLVDRPPQGHGGVLGTITEMAQVSVLHCRCISPGSWLGSFSCPFGVSIRHPLSPLTGNSGVLRNEVSKDKTLFSSGAALSSQGFGVFSLQQRGCPAGSLPEHWLQRKHCQQRLRVLDSVGSEMSLEACLGEPLNCSLPHLHLASS